MKRIFLLLLVITSIESASAQRQPWTPEQAKKWYATLPFLAGANYVPSTAINQLEMWQADTFDSATISRELGWASNTGFNCMRVFLHSLAWKADPKGFKQRVNTYLGIADRNGIKTMFVFFDDVWNKEPKAGKQPAPKPGIHNSGWMQDPGQKASSDQSTFPELEKYVKDVMTTFKNDKRVLMWDLYNEPGNTDKRSTSLPLLKEIFQWAREVNPAQPITVGLWRWDLDSLNEYQFRNSDVITYHNYDPPAEHQRVIDILQASGKPLICTEYMARTRNSRFSNILPILKAENVGAIHWGLVEGKTNTIYQWDTPMPDGGQPVEWFHDVFFRDGKPYRQDEVDLIRKITGKAKMKVKEGESR